MLHDARMSHARLAATMACACFLFAGFLSEAQAPSHHTPEGFRNNYPEEPHASFLA
jgi:heme A synthase